ncbi:MAG: Stk1 family PASTA domain-containing Ser/Thr kinase [Bacillota bacterium]|jgi:beta-lactam-binding protein with PASTA domain/tRNA A-37 threonylcarbamoyl transferase component Bud32
MASGDIAGRKVLNRYKILERLGGGGMSVVWKAYDLVLDRNVALKVLRPEMSEDDEFISRFRREAQSVASLSHPNIVSIYDVGEDSGLYFIIMELVEGETLRDMLRARGRLSVPEALQITSKICQGLAHAHARRIIHRDIKPQNILITPQGDVKVADFGIARALGGVSTTSRDVVIGSAPYLSPEQAKNGTVTVHSDLYSLGVVLYEMLTGKPPFGGDSPVAVALQHVQGEVPRVGSSRPDVPPEVDELVQKALAKNPADRFSSAEHMLEAIRSIETGVRLESPPSKSVEREASVKLSEGDEVDLGRRPVKRRRMSAGAKVFLALAVVVLVLGTYAFLRIKAWLTVPILTVPDVVGKNYIEAQNIVNEAGFVFQIAGERPHDTLARGQVIEQNPLGGEQAKKGRVIYCLISKGQSLARVPEVRGMTQTEAIVEIQNAGIQVGNIREVASDTVAKGLVIGQNPYPGLDVPRDSFVDLEVSKGPEPITAEVPDVIGKMQDEAVRLIEERLLDVGNIVLREDPDVPEGRVISQSPEPGEEVPFRTKVSLVVASRPGANEHTAVKVVEAPYDPRGGMVNVQVFVKDQQGERQVFDGNLRSGERREIRFTWQGSSAVVRTIVGGKVSIQTIRPPRQ